MRVSSSRPFGVQHGLTSRPLAEPRSVGNSLRIRLVLGDNSNEHSTYDHYEMDNFVKKALSK